MPPESVQLGLFVIEEAIKYEPAIAAAIRDLFTKTDPTPADWAALRAKVGKGYRDYVPATALPADTTIPPAAAPELTVPAAVFTGQTVDPHAAK